MDASGRAPRIGKTLKRARERKRMSQAEAAEALGVSRSALNAWENDRAYPRSSIGAIEELYGISLDDEPEQRPAVPPGLLREIMNTEGLTMERRLAVIAAVEATLAREQGEGGRSAAEMPPAEEGRPERRRSVS
jgi:transcriptional regulator with XRE-family HTH domain